MKKYEFFEHTADVKFKSYGGSLNEVFENCALAVSKIISRDGKIKSKKKKKIEIESDNNESLLYNFIDELLYLLDAEEFVVSKAVVKISKTKLKADIFGDDSQSYENLDHIKAATYSEMYIKEIKKGKWEAQAVVDV
ncbi:TPA: archease [Candidatus Pacearchaeota archaeon]|jgi:SHS2 domain-containing protein|nr:archease [Candidatus Pacearchaeota archaeon]